MNSLQPINKETALAAQTTNEPILAVIERAARDPNVDVAKMERLLEMAEKVHSRQAETAFDSAMNACQSEMRPVARDCDNPQTRSRYASYGALDNAVRPIYSTHGFALSFGTKSQSAERITVTCRVSHRAGFARDIEIEMPADGKGAKGGDVMTKTHATGSAVSYGMRYLLKMIFNIALGEFDDDGNAAGRTRPHSPPAYTPRTEPKNLAAEAVAKPLEERIAGMKIKLGGSLPWAENYLRAHGTDGNESTGALLPNQGINDLSVEQVDYLSKNWAKFLAAVHAWGDTNDQIEGAEAPEKPAQPAKQQELATGDNTETGILEKVSIKEGSGKGGPWTRYGLAVNKQWHNTFSKSIGEAALEFEGQQVTITYESDEYGRKALSLTDSTGNTVSAED